MSAQPEALRLADALEMSSIFRVRLQAAAELRRLSAENAELWKEREEPHRTIQMYVLECNRLENERDEARRTVREAHEAGTRLTAQRDALRAELKEATEAINDPAVNNLRTLAESIRMLSNQRDALLERADTLQRWYDQQLDSLAAIEAQRDALLGLLKEARKIIRATSSRNLVKDWDRRTTAAIKAVEEGK